MVKISFVSDIMCDLHTIRKMERSGNRSFKSFFEPMRDKLADFDYVVANLETVMAGEDQKFTRDLTSFNTPDAMAEAISTSGISLATTANTLPGSGNRGAKTHFGRFGPIWHCPYGHLSES